MAQITQLSAVEFIDLVTGIAEGSGREVADIIAINVRTEITFGLFSDGCTALSWKTEDGSYLAQNWDWMEAQKEVCTLCDRRVSMLPLLTT